MLTTLVLCLLAAWAETARATSLTLWFVQEQDVPVLLIMAAAIVPVVFWPPRWPLPANLPANWVLLLAGAVLSALLAWGTYALMGNFPLSRDEHMVLFDMAIYDKGRLAMPLAPEWRPYAIAMVPEFLLNNKQPIGLVSGYLPMNALLRLVFSKLFDPAWFNPVQVVIGGVALVDIARRLFAPDDRPVFVILLVYALSAQMLANAMTAYSMTGHMVLNMVWLAVFLRGGKWGHAAAILTGFVAVGYHQLVFHPLFVAPLLWWRFRDGDGKTVLLYAASYAAIILWWACYPLIVSPEVTAAGARASDDDFLSERVLPLLINHDPATVALMILNMLRFVAWENFALVPLVIAALPAARQGGMARPLFIGILLWGAFLAFVLPTQGRGWGYRYMSPYIGSFALLAGYGYREMEQRIGRAADGMVILLSSLTLVTAIPLQLIAAREFVRPHLKMQRLVSAQPTPFVLIDNQGADTTDGRFGENATDHVRNMPDLSNRPLRLGSRQLNLTELVELCRRGPVTLITRADMHSEGFVLNVPERSPRFEALIAAAARGAPRCFKSAAAPSSRAG